MLRPELLIDLSRQRPWSEDMNLATAAALSECRSALLEGPTAARTALAKHQASIALELAQALEAVGSYDINEDGRTPLHEAVVNGDVATVKALIVAVGPKEVEIADRNYATPLDLATDDTCREILEHHAAVLNAITENLTKLVGAALAHCITLSASKKEQLHLAALPLRAYYFDPCFFWAPPVARTAVVGWARSYFIVELAASIQPFEALPDDCAGDVLEFFGMSHKEVKLFAKHCFSLEAQDWVRALIAGAVVAKATAALVPAAKAGDFTIVLDCLSKRANIDVKVGGRTALVNATHIGHTDIVKVLLRAGADTEAKDGLGQTALMEASRKDHTDIVKVLSGAGANTEAKDDFGRTALMCASDNVHTNSVQVLLEAGADTEAKDSLGRTALLEASHNGHADSVQVLLGAGADTEAKDSHDRTALVNATHIGHTAIVQVLLGAGADTEARDSFGRTALLEVSRNGQANSVQVLSGAGADREAKDSLGRTALLEASRYGHTGIVHLLLGAGADT